MKRIAVQLHLWLGLTVGLLWALQGLTGAALVFHREIDRWAHPERVGTAGPMAPVDRLIAAAKEAGGTPKRLSVADARPDLLMADVEDASGEVRQIFLDAATARVVDQRAAEPSAPGGGATSRFLYQFHERLLAGESGEAFIGASGLLLLSSALLGLWIGWPRVWRGVANVQAWRSRPQKLYGWHRMVGLGAGVGLLILVPGGVYMAFSEPVRNAVATVAPVRLPYKAPPIEATPAAWVPAQAALDTARARFPDAAFVRIGLPSAKSPAYTIRLRQPGEVRAWSGTTAVAVDAITGSVLDVYDPLTAPLANRLFDAAFAVHNGEIAGPLGRLLVLLTGLSLPTFYVTGVWLWLTKRRRRTAAVPMPAE